MAAYVNRKIDNSGGTDTTDVPLNRWGPTEYGIQIESGTWNFEGTLDRPNRGEIAVYDTISVIDGSGATVAAVGLTDGFYKVDFLPLEVIRATSTAAGNCRIMQQGATDWA